MRQLSKLMCFTLLYRPLLGQASNRQRGLEGFAAELSQTVMLRRRDARQHEQARLLLQGGHAVLHCAKVGVKLGQGCLSFMSRLGRSSKACTLDPATFAIARVSMVHRDLGCANYHYCCFTTA